MKARCSLGLLAIDGKDKGAIGGKPQKRTKLIVDDCKAYSMFSKKGAYHWNSKKRGVSKTCH